MTDTPISDAILPCPFCGGIAVITHKDFGSRVECLRRFDGCSMNMRTHHHVSDKNAVNAWNNRASRKAEIESLRARNNELYAELANERIARFAVEAKLATVTLTLENELHYLRDNGMCLVAVADARIRAETARCAKIASEFQLSPVVGKAIAALIMEGR